MMNPFDPDPYQEVARYQAEQRARMQQARVLSYHSRTGLLTRYVRRLADRIDPTGRVRRRLG